MDRANQQRFIEFLQTLKQELGLTVIMVSHDLRAVSAIADRIACLNLTLHYHDVPERMPGGSCFTACSPAICRRWESAQSIRGVLMRGAIMELFHHGDTQKRRNWVRSVKAEDSVPEFQ